MACQKCGCAGPVKPTKFMANIGLLVLRFETGEEGYFCKPCIHGSFFKHQAICMFLGWWGIISFFFNFYFLISNFAEWASCFGMDSPGAQAAPLRANLPRLQRYRRDRSAPPRGYSAHRRRGDGAARER